MKFSPCHIYDTSVGGGVVFKVVAYRFPPKLQYKKFIFQLNIITIKNKP